MYRTIKFVYMVIIFIVLCLYTPVITFLLLIAGGIIVAIAKEFHDAPLIGYNNQKSMTLSDVEELLDRIVELELEVDKLESNLKTAEKLMKK